MDCFLTRLLETCHQLARQVSPGMLVLASVWKSQYPNRLGGDIVYSRKGIRSGLAKKYQAGGETAQCLNNFLLGKIRRRVRLDRRRSPQVLLLPVRIGEYGFRQRHHICQIHTANKPGRSHLCLKVCCRMISLHIRLGDLKLNARRIEILPWNIAHRQPNAAGVSILCGKIVQCIDH